MPPERRPAGRRRIGRRARRPARLRDETGFTLVELLVVLAVLSLSLGLVLQRGPSRSAALDVRGAAGEVAEALRGARGRAIATNRRVPVTFDIQGGRYSVGPSPPRALPAGLRLSLLTSADLTAPGERTGAIDFLPDGSTSGGRVGLTAGGSRAWVVVDWLTGRVGITDVPPADAPPADAPPTDAR